MTNANFEYTGTELETFSVAYNWKQYYKQLVKEHLKAGPTLEVGAGIGEIAKLFRSESSVDEWICLEPDLSNAKKIKYMLDSGCLGSNVKIITQFLENSGLDNNCLSNVLFVDSLEHIQDDINSLNFAFDLLVDGGILIIIAPAHNFLYSRFDKQVGHYRRYNFESLSRILPKNSSVIKFSYFDSVGLFLNLANKYLLKSGNPKKNQILFWDRFVVPVSKIVDRFTHYKFGKNLVMIIEKRNDLRCS